MYDPLIVFHYIELNFIFNFCSDLVHKCFQTLRIVEGYLPLNKTMIKPLMVISDCNSDHKLFPNRSLMGFLFCL